MFTDLEKKAGFLKKKAEVYRVLLSREVNPTMVLNNLIYYTHTDTFTFGWSKPLSFEQEQTVKAQIKGLDYNFEIKTV